ncbi:MAG TPA: YoaK family protein [Streptosporangiaceae bacterium]|nr:YoaK family protein [Streptosporangiaceae bacterium]
MTTFFADIRDTIAPRAGSAHGPLGPVLVSMTIVTGLVDAFSYLVLGHVFVANMTGNIVFLGFALAGAKGFSVAASAVALVAFGAGALLGGRLAARHSEHRGRLHSSAAAVQTLFLAVALVLAVVSASPLPAGYRYALISGLGISMGIQNAAARKIAVPDLTTTVLTLTITGIAADSGLAGGGRSQAGRRLVPVASMLAGALVGAALVLHAEIYYPLAIALAVVLAGGMVTRRLGKPDPEWTRPAGPAGGTRT